MTAVCCARAWLISNFNQKRFRAVRTFFFLPVIGDAGSSFDATDVWLLAALGMLLAAAVGFAAGVQYERTSLRRLFRKTHRQAAKLFRAVVGQLDTVKEVCSFVESSQELLLTSDQVAELENRQQALGEALAKIVEDQKSRASVSRPAPKLVHRPLAEPPETVSWQAPSDDEVDESSGDDCLMANLQILTDLARDTGLQSGLLLVQVDKLDQLKKRYGARDVERFAEAIGSLIGQEIRDRDLMCRCGEGTFGVLFAHADCDEGRRLSESIRNGIRHHRFRLSLSGQEVLVTASLGYAQCLPNDHPGFVLNRAQEALEKSRSHGRNQLHVSLGADFVHCLAS